MPFVSSLVAQSGEGIISENCEKAQSPRNSLDLGARERQEEKWKEAFMGHTLREKEKRRQT